MRSIGQVSLESLIMIGVVMVLFLLAIAMSVEIGVSSNSISSYGPDDLQCSRLSGLIQESFVQGPGTRVGLTMNSASSVSVRSVLVNQAVCNFSASVLPANLNAGRVLIKNISGTVTVLNG